MVIELRGRHGEVLKRIDTASQKHCVGVFIQEMPADDRREHFPCRAGYPTWDRKRKIADLPEPPAEVR